MTDIADADFAREPDFVCEGRSRVEEPYVTSRVGDSEDVGRLRVIHDVVELAVVLDEADDSEIRSEIEGTDAAVLTRAEEQVGVHWVAADSFYGALRKM